MISGFLKTGTASSRQGNNGIMDIIGGLHFLKEILPGFGGDPNRITLLGHGTGATLANIIAISPISKGEFYKQNFFPRPLK